MPDYGTLEAIYRQGMRDIEAHYGAETRDYERVLGGLGAVLDHQGLESWHMLGWVMELHEAYHYPLAQYGPDHTLAQVCAAVGAVAQGSEMRRVAAEVAAGRVAAELDRAAYGPASPQLCAQLRDRVAAAERPLKEAVGEVERLRRRVEILGALLGPEHPATAHHTALADQVEGGIAATRERGQAVLARVGAARAQIPVERARTLQALADLPVQTRRWFGNVVEPGRLVSDEHLILDTSLAVAGPLARLRVADSARAALLPQTRVLAAWERAVSAATTPVTLLGWLPEPELDNLPRAYVVIESGSPEVVWVRADLLRLIAAVTGWDRLTATADEAHNLVVWRGETPVAALGSMPTVEQLAVDVTTARAGAAASAPLPTPAKSARRGKTAASLLAAPAP